jgi:hypothetical protein
MKRKKRKKNNFHSRSESEAARVAEICLLVFVGRKEGESSGERVSCHSNLAVKGFRKGYSKKQSRRSVSCFSSNFV